MPSGFRPALKEDGLVVAQGKDGNIAIFPTGTFESIAREELEALGDRKARRRSRAIFGPADSQKLDAQGRVLLKPNLRRYAGIDQATEVAVVGMYDRIEVWDVESFNAALAEAEAEYRADEEVPGF